MYWDVYKGFDPFKVRSTKLLDLFSYTLADRLKSATYKPQTAIKHMIPKLGGGYRELNIFPIPDASVSRLIYKSLLEKNVNRFSAYAYAYREERSAHDAILRITYDWRTKNRVYVAEFDFSKFFDRIEHSYLWNVLDTQGFLFTDLERQVLRAFLSSNSSNAPVYQPHSGIQRERGIPQGTSVSLFLANVACWELDQEMERIGVLFARYADDTLVWSNSYERIVKAYDAIEYFGKLMGVPINFEKSEGITIISDRKSEELKSKSKVVFLGYEVSLRYVSVSVNNERTIKEKISSIINENLLQPIKSGVFNLSRLNMLDWDYVVALYQIRRYLYGGLDDTQLRRFKMGIIPELRFRGVMSYYPLVDNDDQLRKLDGWLIHSLQQALRLRQKIWIGQRGMSLPGPSADWIDKIVSIKKWKSPLNGTIYDLRVPSFLQINQAMQIGLRRGGINSVANPKSKYYPGNIRRK